MFKHKIRRGFNFERKQKLIYPPTSRNSFFPLQLWIDIFVNVPECQSLKVKMLQKNPAENNIC